MILVGGSHISLFDNFIHKFCRFFHAHSHLPGRGIPIFQRCQAFPVQVWHNVWKRGFKPLHVKVLLPHNGEHPFIHSLVISQPLHSYKIMACHRFQKRKVGHAGDVRMDQWECLYILSSCHLSYFSSLSQSDTPGDSNPANPLLRRFPIMPYDSEIQRHMRMVPTQICPGQNTEPSPCLWANVS